MALQSGRKTRTEAEGALKLVNRNLYYSVVPRTIDS